MQEAKLIRKNMVTRFIADERGATALEYGLIAAVLSLVVATAVATLGTSLTALFQHISDLFA
ncbi:MAG: Flp family type IVb pilin [Parvibaculaceae bacterium]